MNRFLKIFCSRDRPQSKRGEGYVDMCIGVVIFVMLIVIAINIFSFIALRVEMDRFADDVIELVAAQGYFGGTEYTEMIQNNELYKRDADDAEFDLTTGNHADEYWYDPAVGGPTNKVQLGHPMTFEVTVKTNVKGLGIFKIPVTLKVKRTGLSQKYWK